jgi:hypothetical protein
MGVEVENFVNVVGLLTFVDVHIDCIAFPSSQELNVMT